MLDKKQRIKLYIILIILNLLGAELYWHWDDLWIGYKIDSFKGVPVYYNGEDYERSHGKNYSTDGYYYGYKWQCVEYVKRYYYQVKNHRMPDVFGDARDFFDVQVPQGGLNKSRGLKQYRNGGDIMPQVDDLVVFTDSKYGHVAIISEITPESIEIIQQNVIRGSRQIIKLRVNNGHYYLGTGNQPVGWLRKD